MLLAADRESGGNRTMVMKNRALSIYNPVYYSQEKDNMKPFKCTIMHDLFLLVQSAISVYIASYMHNYGIEIFLE